MNCFFVVVIIPFLVCLEASVFTVAVLAFKYLKLDIESEMSVMLSTVARSCCLLITLLDCDGIIFFTDLFLELIPVVLKPLLDTDVFNSLLTGFFFLAYAKYVSFTSFSAFLVFTSVV